MRLEAPRQLMHLIRKTRGSYHGPSGQLHRSWVCYEVKITLLAQIRLDSCNIDEMVFIRTWTTLL